MQERQIMHNGREIGSIGNYDFHWPEKSEPETMYWRVFWQIFGPN